MKVLVLSIFPELLEPHFKTSLLGKAQDSKILQLTALNIRNFAAAPHFKVDDQPYGGGPGMVMRPEPLCAAIRAAKQELPQAPVLLMSASGQRFVQASARRLSTLPELILVCGRYEGIDQRVIDSLVDEEICIGDYVLMGGEVAALAVLEACTRLIPGVLGNQASLLHESFEDQLLEGPQYTRPAEFEGCKVPSVLTSGNHQEILSWRRAQAQQRTARVRPEQISGKSGVVSDEH